MITSISHITFVVADVDAAARLFCEGLGAKEVYDSFGEHFSLSREKFFVLGDLWLVVMEGTVDKPRSYQHVAFQVTEEALPVIVARLQHLGIEFRPGRPRVVGEAQSIYFYDFDNNLFELHTGSLDERLTAYARQSNLS